MRSRLRPSLCLLFCIVLAVSGLDVSGLVSGAHAEEIEPRILEVTGDDVNLRAGPSIDHHDVGQLSRGDVVFEVGRDGEFVRVRVPGGVPVYVFAALLDWDGPEQEDSGENGPSPETGAETGAEMGARGALRCRVSADDVLMRATPTTAHYPLHDQKLRRGTELVVIGAEDSPKGRWLRVVTPEVVHVWIHGRYVRPADPAPSRAELAKRARDRLDALTEGRTRVEREHLTKDRRERFETELRAIAERADEGQVGADVERAARELADTVAEEALRVRALALAERIVGLREARAAERRAAEAERRGPATGDVEGRDDAAEKERERRRLEDQRLRREAERERARLQREQREKTGNRGAPTVAGVVRVVGSSILLDASGNVTVELASTRYRLEDFARKRVRIWGRRLTRDGRRDRVEVTSIEIVTRETR